MKPKKKNQRQGLYKLTESRKQPIKSNDVSNEMIFLLQLLIVGMPSVARGRLVTEFLPSFFYGLAALIVRVDLKDPIKSNDVSNEMIFLLQLLIVGMSSVARGRLVTEFLPSFTVWPC